MRRLLVTDNLETSFREGLCNPKAIKECTRTQVYQDSQRCWGVGEDPWGDLPFVSSSLIPSILVCYTKVISSQVC